MLNNTYTGAPLRGIAVGNGCSGSEIGTCGWGAQSTYYETKYLLGHAFVSEALREKIDGACDWTVAKYNNGSLSPECEALVSEMHDQVGNINIYNVFGECISGSPAEIAGRGVLKAPRASTPAWRKSSLRGPNACIDSIAGTAWINQPEVIEALHVVQQSFDWCVAIIGNHCLSAWPESSSAYPWCHRPWQVYLWKPNSLYVDSSKSASGHVPCPERALPCDDLQRRLGCMRAVHGQRGPTSLARLCCRLDAWVQVLIVTLLRVCGSLLPGVDGGHGLRRSERLARLDLSVSRADLPVMLSLLLVLTFFSPLATVPDNGNQVAGYATVYATPHNFTFITVRGGRHEVPETQPERASEMLRKFLTNTPF